MIFIPGQCKRLHAPTAQLSPWANLSPPFPSVCLVLLLLLLFLLSSFQGKGEPLQGLEAVQPSSFPASPPPSCILMYATHALRGRFLLPPPSSRCGHGLATSQQSDLSWAAADRAIASLLLLLRLLGRLFLLLFLVHACTFFVVGGRGGGLSPDVGRAGRGGWGGGLAQLMVPSDRPRRKREEQKSSSRIIIIVNHKYPHPSPKRDGGRPKRIKGGWAAFFALKILKSLFFLKGRERLREGEKGKCVLCCVVVFPPVRAPIGGVY